MTERINHAAHTERCIVAAEMAASEGMSQWYIEVAKIHASLAIADQLRVANIIALGGDVWDVSEAVNAVLDITPANRESNRGQVINGLQPEIKAVLGL